MNAVIKASGNDVESYWPLLFAKALKGADVADLLSNIGTAAAAGPAAATGPVAAAAVVEEEKKEEVEDVDMGGLFGDEDDY